MFTEILNLLLSTFFYFFIIIVFLRFLFQLIRADFYNPFSQFILTVTNPVLIPLRRIIPAWKNIDSASLVLIVLLKIIELCLRDLLAFGSLSSLYKIFAVSVMELTRMGINFYFFAILAQIILSWLSPHNNNPLIGLLQQITNPIMSPARKLIPPIGGLDLSPILVILALQILETLLLHPYGLLPNLFRAISQIFGLS